jgi:hypothetical protein
LNILLVSSRFRRLIHTLTCTVRTRAPGLEGQQLNVFVCVFRTWERLYVYVFRTWERKVVFKKNLISQYFSFDFILQNYVQTEPQARTGRGIHGRTKVSCGPAMPDPYAPCGLDWSLRPNWARQILIPSTRLLESDYQLKEVRS